jgi:F-box and leucine-rich repeat protein GRR1
MYRHFAPSNTSLSDNDYDDEEPAQSNFFIGGHPLFLDAAIQPHWSRSSQPDRLATDRKATLKSPISTIPPEILIYILKHLHTPRDLLNSLRVSRTWCECAVELLWHKPAFTRHSTLEKMTRVLKRPNQTFDYTKFIRRLNFLNLGKELRDETFITFAQCDRLERLTLSGCQLLTASHLEAALIKYPSLVAVDLTNVKETTNEAIVAFAQIANRLQGINLQSCTNVGDPALLALAEHCPLLRRVKLSGLEEVSDEGVSAIVKGCPLLLEIDLHQCERITDVSVRDIWIHSSNMREMRLSQCSKITDLAFPVAPKFDINGEPIPPASGSLFPNRDNAELPPLVISRVFDQLRMLDLTACANITDDAVEGIISHAPKIRNLVLSKCILLTDRSVEAICSLGRNLHYLHLGHASKITDKSVKTLARACNRIRYVDFASQSEAILLI